MIKLILKSIYVFVVSCSIFLFIRFTVPSKFIYVSSTQETYQKIHSFYAKNNSHLGDVLVKYVNDSLISEMLIVNTTNGNIDTLYSIDSTKLSNPHGIDLQFNSAGFFGYLIVLKASDYIVLSFLSNFGENVADDITIEWNYEKNVFERMLTP